MHTSTLYLVILSIAATLVSARPSLAHFRSLVGAPYKRQSTGIPSSCASICDPVNNEVNMVSYISGLSHLDVPILIQGCPATACCTQSFETSYYGCLLCVGTADNVTDYSQAQTDLDGGYTHYYPT